MYWSLSLPVELLHCNQVVDRGHAHRYARNLEVAARCAKLPVRGRPRWFAQDVECGERRVECEHHPVLERLRIELKGQIRRRASKCRAELPQRLGEAVEVLRVARVGDVDVETR
jgi:hypothetical protein